MTAHYDPFKENRDDFRHYYRGCWIKYTRIGSIAEPSIGSIEDITGSKSYIYINDLLIKRPGQFYVDTKKYAVEDLSIDFSIPDLGMCNLDKSCAYISMNPQRQYKKGVDLHNRFIYPLLSDNYLCSIFPYDTNSNNYFYEIIYRMHNRLPFLSISQAIEKFKKAKGKIAAIALSPKFGLSLSKKVKDIILFYKNYPIGYIKMDTGEVIMSKEIKEKFPHIVTKFNREVIQ